MTADRSVPCPCIVALDYPDESLLFAFLDSVNPRDLPWVKVGLQSFCHYGPDLVRTIASRGFQIFLDLKLYDIPNTVAGAVESLASLPIQMLTLHAGGGLEMMARAREAQKQFAPELRLLAVTVLTSFDSEGLAATGVTEAPAAQVTRLVALAREAGIDGIVCSAHEIAALRARFGRDPYLVTPGIRPAGSALDDQRRAMTPAEAVAAGADALVVGRPITAAEDPVAAIRAIYGQMVAATPGVS